MYRVAQVVRKRTSTKEGKEEKKGRNGGRRKRLNDNDEAENKREGKG